jgi:hypothetical protein
MSSKNAIVKKKLCKLYTNNEFSWVVVKILKKITTKKIYRFELKIYQL